MFDVLRFKAEAPVARISAALTRTPARQVALVFPLGVPVAIADLAALSTLSAQAQRARKAVTIVGGDALLRACAVTAGFAATTSVEEWRAAKDARATGSSGGHAPAFALLTPASGGHTAGAACPEDNAAWELDPPAYIARLLHDVGHEEPRSFDDLAPADSSGKLRALPPPSDAAAYLAAIHASERHEEEISDAIRETSGFQLGVWVSSASLSAGERNFGESRPS
jgi:hypothetical protein